MPGEGDTAQGLPLGNETQEEQGAETDTGGEDLDGSDGAFSLPLKVIPPARPQISRQNRSCWLTQLPVVL